MTPGRFPNLLPNLFPNLLGIPPEKTPEGVIAVGGDLNPETLIDAYRKGIFPWPVSQPDQIAAESDGCDDARVAGSKSASVLAWFSPHPRAILVFHEIHVPRSLKHARNQQKLRFTHDQAFLEVITACQAVPRPGQSGTWITSDMLDAYCALHRLGIAHSFEAWEQDRLVGGVYGVSVDGIFAGESMFHRTDNASKLTLLHMAEYFIARGLEWMDIQMMTPHMKSLGAREISRDDFLLKLLQTRASGLKLF
jgi:leucyl/phenylalanyl-tRNA--protein transferase